MEKCMNLGSGPVVRSRGLFNSLKSDKVLNFLPSSNYWMKNKGKNVLLVSL